MESLSARQNGMIHKIHNRVSLLKTDGLTNRDQKTWKNNRLSFIWGEPWPSSESSVTTWRKSRARRAYEEIQVVSYHLFLAVAIEVPPTECGRTSFEAILDYILQQEDYEQYNFNLGPATRKFLRLESRVLLEVVATLVSSSRSSLSEKQGKSNLPTPYSKQWTKEQKEGGETTGCVTIIIPTDEDDDDDDCSCNIKVNRNVLMQAVEDFNLSQLNLG
ncbi:hypothetical protein PENNAL_c0051G08984 [Penicillium nalgiovense]|uniref:Uncharacterized protein n=1 Tax=Penicillium nalgiovense TaxID=60175 RepID=A0A1V6XWN0_PENNA|nr:hypothetical protein PENNAL_c0051G08984 [Penicillium nalgiovense]